MNSMAARFRRIWEAQPDGISVLLLILVAVVAVSPRIGPPNWTSDGLFYEAQVHQLRGQSQAAALHEVFLSRAAAPVRRSLGTRLDDPAWISYSARFYRRRWLVPLIAAGLYPAAGERSLLYASMLGYVAAGLLLFALLRRRFGTGVSLMVGVACLLLPPLREASGQPLTDSWGLALEAGALLAALLALERGRRWIALWGVAMLVLSFTRDATVVLLIATAWLFILARTRRAAAVLAVGIVASLPAPAIFNAPLVQQLSWSLNGFRIAHPANWSFVAHHLPTTLLTVLKDDLTYPSGRSLPLVLYALAAIIVAAVAYMVLAAPRDGSFFALHRAAIAGGLVTIALAGSSTSLRLELVLVPSLAAALAFAIEQLRLDGPDRASVVRQPRLPGRRVSPSSGPSRYGNR